MNHPSNIAHPEPDGAATPRPVTTLVLTVTVPVADLEMVRYALCALRTGLEACSLVTDALIECEAAGPYELSATDAIIVAAFTDEAAGFTNLDEPDIVRGRVILRAAREAVAATEPS